MDVDRQEPGSLIALETSPLSSTEIQELKPCLKEPLFVDVSGGRGVRLREERLEGKVTPSAEGGCPQHLCLTLPSSPTAAALAFGVRG